MFEQLGLTSPSPLSVTTLLVNLFLGGALSLALSRHYVRFGQTYSNRVKLAQVFPLMVLVTILIISVIKSSLALSLGLVGALSIVRFRTPIKEPEELAYLFMAIAIGLGLGADQRVPTIVATVVIMGIITARSLMFQKTEESGVYFNIEAQENSGEDDIFRRINRVLTQHVLEANMRRLDVRDGMLQATYYIDCKNSENLTELMDGLKADFPDSSISFIKRDNV